MRRFLILSFLLAFSSLASAKAVFDYSVDAVDLYQSSDDSVVVDITYNILSCDVKKKKALVLQGFLNTGESSYPLRAISFYSIDAQGVRYNVRSRGTTASGTLDELGYVTGTFFGKVHLISSIAIPSDMGDCTVSVVLSEMSFPDNRKVLDTRQVASFVHSSKPAVEPEFYYLPAADDRNEEHVSSSVMYLAFDSDKTVFDNKFAMNETESFDFVRDVSSLISSPLTKVSQVYFNGYCGIEGAESANLKRSKSRTQSVYNFLVGKKTFGKKKVSVNGYGEDWKTVDLWVAGTYWSKDAGYRDVIMKEPKNDAREKAIKEEYPALWESMSLNLFPRLERYEAVLVYSVKPFGDDEARLKAYNEDRRLLCQYDFYHLLGSQKMYSDIWFEILSDWVTYYPFSEVALLNLSAANIACGRLREADEFLRLLGDSEDVRYYRALWFFYQDDLHSAMELASSLNDKNPVFSSFVRQLNELSYWRYHSFVREDI